MAESVQVADLGCYASMLGSRFKSVFWVVLHHTTSPHGLTTQKTMTWKYIELFIVFFFCYYKHVTSCS